MTARRQLHWSHLSALSKCGEAFRLAYVERLRVRPGVAAVVGTAAHVSAALNLTAKRDTGSLLPLDAVTQAARDSIAEQWEQGVTLLPEEADRATQTHGEAIDRSVRFAEMHHRILAPRLNPVHVERAWVVTPEGFPFDLAGEIDVQEPDTIRDLKTAGKKPTAATAATSGQLTMYAIARQALDGELPKRVALDYCTDAKTDPVGSFVSERTPEHVAAFWRRLEQAAEVIERQVFTPADPLTSWFCGPRWCGYARTNPATGQPFCRYYAAAPAFVAMPGTTTPKETTTDEQTATRTRTPARKISAADALAGL